LEGSFNDVKSITLPEPRATTAPIVARPVLLPARLAWIVPVVVIGAEVALALAHPVFGLVLYAMAMLAMFGVLARRELNSMFEHLTIATLAFCVVRMVSVSMLFTPQPRHVQVIATALTSAIALLMATRAIKPQSRIEFDATSIPAMMLQFAAVLFGLSLGSLFFGLQSAGLAPRLPALAPTLNSPTYLLATLGIMLFGAVEEALLRRLMLRAAMPLIESGGVLLVALLQTATAGVYQSPYVAIYMFSFGMIFGLIAYVSGSSVGVILGHTCANFVIACLGPLFGRDAILQVAMVCSIFAVLLSAPPLWLHVRASIALAKAGLQ
jgi:membrane protease YdiL (CAAX protease family)